ncbi:MAG: NAD-dependent epimerase/dehydratase family protein [Promethearchaeota archaeon]
MERVLITGNLGYIGTIMTQDLLEEDYNVIGLDTNFYRDYNLIKHNFSKEYKQLFKDLREVTLEDFKGIDVVIHLAALSNDPLGKLNPKLTNEINFLSSLKMAKFAKKSGVSRFLFSSSCSIYGQTKDAQLTEDAPMNPLSAYAHSKVNLERELRKLAGVSFSPIYLRNGTAYGISPNMRFDLVVNNLAGWGFTTKEIKILSDGRAWRPIVHIKDISKAFIAALKAPKDVIHNEAFNVGINSENYQVKTIAKEIQNQMRDCEIKILGENNPDQRNYNVNFDKINTRLKSFKPQWTLEKGIKELINTFKEIDLDYEIFQNKNFTRLNQLKFLLKNNLIDDNLYWK